jgi:hypothetical protein
LTFAAFATAHRGANAQVHRTDERIHLRKQVGDDRKLALVELQHFAPPAMARDTSRSRSHHKRRTVGRAFRALDMPGIPAPGLPMKKGFASRTLEDPSLELGIPTESRRPTDENLTRFGRATVTFFSVKPIEMDQLFRMS